MVQQEAESLVRRRRQRKSILDFVLEDAHRLERKVNYKDKQKLEIPHRREGD